MSDQQDDQIVMQTVHTGQGDDEVEELRWPSVETAR